VRYVFGRCCMDRPRIDVAHLVLTRGEAGMDASPPDRLPHWTRQRLIARPGHY
jgi:hypothetical protein